MFFIKIKFHFFSSLSNIRIFFGLSILLLFRKKKFFKKLYQTIYNLHYTGFHKIENYYDEHDIFSLENFGDKVLDDVKNNKILEQNIEKIDGTIKVKHIDQNYKIIRRYSHEIFFILVNFFFRGKLNVPVCLYDLSHDGSYKSDVVLGKSNNRIAGSPHIDRANDYLKIFILLRDLDLENGPTALIPNSSTSKFLKPTIFELMKPRNQRKLNYDEIIDSKLMTYFEKHNPSKFLTGKKGDIFFINTRNIHWASNLRNGVRKLIWFYF